jgi:hypothetical protein
MSATHVWVEHRPPAFQETSGINILRERPLKFLLQGAGPGQGQSDTVVWCIWQSQSPC